MKKYLLIPIALFMIIPFLCGISQAFLYDINILPRTAIEKLTDKALLDAYIDAMIELEAAQTFHQTSGFTKAEEYEKFKALLRYRTDLILEIKKRELELPQITP